MATLRRGLVDKVKKVAAKAGTRGARALVETTAAAVKTVDKLQAKLGRHSAKPPAAQESMTGNKASAPKTRRITTKAPPMAMREGGRKTMPAAAPKRSKAAAQDPGFKVKRGQKHRHTGR